ncbi:MAG: polysaccharide pyruvyl transferase family protein [Roseburia sp.]|nr:polysaccharide pyruvyl transferase family protein [Roseburia sp.]
MNVTILDTTIGSTDRGDDIVLQNCEKAIQPLIDNSFSMRFATHLLNFRFYQYFRNGMKLQYTDSCDYKFIMGTNLLTSDIISTRGQWMIGPVSKRLYKDSILFGVGTTQDNKKVTPLTKYIYKNILRKDIIHSVRDAQSVHMLEGFLGKGAVVDTGCPTLWGLTPKVCDRIPIKKARDVIVTLSGYADQQDPVQDQKMISILEREYEHIYFWAQTSVDVSYYNSLRHSKDATIIYSLKNYALLCENANVDYVGTRLHGGIYAMQHGVRTLVVEIDHRARGFRESNHINTIERNKIDELPDILNGNIKTEIILKEREIKEFLSQIPFVKEQISMME